ncbi:nucleolar protein dao-5-like [Haliotis cracherodii]|uniref:nucleolar protein dao-5-like n=1 Tax=Haliotis cracherodii TaxID=6455 RepID=UPI0039EBC87C
MDKKAKLFTKRFAERLAKGKPKEVKKKSLLLKSIQNISKESLKRELKDNIDLYLKYLNKCLKRLSVDTPRCSQDFQLIQTWEDCQSVVGLTKEASRHLCTQVTLKELGSDQKDFVTTLQKYEDKCDIKSKEMVPAWMATTKHLLASTRNTTIITKLMMYYLSKLQSVAEDSIANGEDVESITSNLKQFLLMAYLRSGKVQADEQEESPKRQDVLASLLSIYIDLLVYLNRNNEKKKVSREITGLTSYLLGGDLPMRLDVLIQVCSPVDSTHVLSLARSCLEKIPEMMDHATYLRVLLCLRKFHDSIPDIIENSWKLRAPLGFIDWLRDKSPEAMTQIPDDIRFKGRQITRFLLTNLSEDLQTVLEDVLTDRQAVSALMPGDDLLDEDGGGDQCETEAKQQLFVMDRGRTTDDRKLKQKSDGKHEKNSKSSTDLDLEEMDVETEDLETSQTVDNTAEVEVIDLSNVLSAIYDSKPDQCIGTEYVSTSSQDSPRKKSVPGFRLPSAKARKGSKPEKLNQVDEIVLDTSDADEAKDVIVPNLAAHIKHAEQVVPDIFIVDDAEVEKAESFTQMKTKGKKGMKMSNTSPEIIESESDDFTLVQMLSPPRMSKVDNLTNSEVKKKNVEQVPGKGKKRLNSNSSLEDNVFSPKRSPGAKVNGKSPSMSKGNSRGLQSPGSVIEIEDTDSAVDTDKDKDLLGSPKSSLSRRTAPGPITRHVLKETIDSDKEQMRMKTRDSGLRKPTPDVLEQDGNASGVGLRSRRRSASESELASWSSEQQMSSPKRDKPNSPIKGSVSSPSWGSKKVPESKILSPFIKPSSTVRDAMASARSSKKTSDEDDASPLRSPRGSKKNSDKDIASPQRSPNCSKKNSDEDVASPLRSPQGSKKNSDTGDANRLRSPQRLIKDSSEKVASPVRSPRRRSSTSLSVEETEELTETPKSPRKKHGRESSAIPRDQTPCLERNIPMSPGKSEGSKSPAKPQLMSPVKESSPVKKKAAPVDESVILKTPSRTPRRKSAMSAQQMSSVAKEAKVLDASATQDEDDMRKSSRKRRSSRFGTDDEDAAPKVKTPRRGKKGSKSDESHGSESGDVLSSPERGSGKASSTSLDRRTDGGSKTKVKENTQATPGRVTKLKSSSDQDIEARSPKSGKKLKKSVSASDGSETNAPELSASIKDKTSSSATPGKNTVRQTSTKEDAKTPRRSSRSAFVDSPMVTRSGRKVKMPKKGKRTPDTTPSSKLMTTIREDGEDGEVVFNMTPSKQRKGGSVSTPFHSGRKKTDA